MKKTLKFDRKNIIEIEGVGENFIIEIRIITVDEVDEYLQVMENIDKEFDGKKISIKDKMLNILKNITSNYNDIETNLKKLTIDEINMIINEIYESKKKTDEEKKSQKK